MKQKQMYSTRLMSGLNTTTANCTPAKPDRYASNASNAFTLHAP